MHRFRFFKNFYVATSVGLLVWILFFELNSVPTQVGNWWKLQQLKREKEYYQDQIETLKKEEAITLSSDKLREKYAREKYFMKKPTEDVFVIVNEQNEPLEK
ncbi:MAG: septum formation initiator family protein [Runella slithyformis]|jgi:cell division protein DivIC|nr:MAG: septum formation initiator family protein [Runella slithyformis]TAF94632.1 MAG: septum formation initiator family protein [Runella sp.]TAG17947.1 MAG: septum formation initiator family protein [Cytophagales bacterium]TAG37455.1 MAG: septum formation initiator family protein [Cytophagia bacterium]TAF29754.1 MAG: septum formation initiator family protein [Runella slithyformis]